MRSDILDAHRTARLHVDVVWLPMLPGDSQRLIDQRVLSDPRVTYYWDPGRVVGAWLSSHVTRRRAITWDAYFLYGPGAEWEAAPSPLLAWGSPVIATRDTLLTRFDDVESAPGAGAGSG